MKLFKNTVLLAICSLLFLYSNHNALALTVSPVKVEVSGDPGQTLRGEMELFNEQASPKTLFSTFENFEPSGETGSPKFIGGGSGLATWLNSDQSTTIEPGQTIKVPYTITIPKDAEPGGYFSAIFWGEQDPGTKNAGEVAIGGKIGVLILLRVNGNIAEVAGLSDYIMVGSKFRSMLPISFTYRFKNEGGDRVVPMGDITVKNIFGGVVATVLANPTEGSVLPNSLRKFETIWGEPRTDGKSLGFFDSVKAQLSDFYFGYYKANLSIKYGSTDQVASSSIALFIIPWQLLLTCFALFLIILFIFRRYNAWIISKSRTSV